MSTSVVIRRNAISTTEAPWVRYTLTGIALVFVVLFLILPLAAVFTEALRKGLGAYFAALQEPDAWSAIKLTLIAAAISVPLNLVFGVAAAWAIAKYEFRGKSFLTTLVDTEGLMQGLDFDLVARLRASTDRRLIVAGGVRHWDDVRHLEALGADAVAGMAVYTGAIAP